MKIIHGAVFIGMAGLGSMAMAQTQGPAPSSMQGPASPSMQGSAPTEQAPSSMGTDQSTKQAAPTASATPVSDTEVQKFATAIVALNKLNGDAAVPAAEKQKDMVAKVKASGLSAERFNQIAKASQSNPQLASRIQAAVTKAKASS